MKEFKLTKKKLRTTEKVLNEIRRRMMKNNPKAKKSLRTLDDALMEISMDPEDYGEP